MLFTRLCAMSQIHSEAIRMLLKDIIPNCSNSSSQRVNYIIEYKRRVCLCLVCCHLNIRSSSSISHGVSVRNSARSSSVFSLHTTSASLLGLPLFSTLFRLLYNSPVLQWVVFNLPASTMRPKPVCALFLSAFFELSLTPRQRRDRESA